MLIGNDLILADRMYRNEATRKLFERETGLRYDEDNLGPYHERFNGWAEDAILHRERCPKANLSGPGGGCNYPMCANDCSGRP